MGVQLHETLYGRKLFDSLLPRLVRSLEDIHSDYQKIIALKEAELKIKQKELELKEKELGL